MIYIVMGVSGCGKSTVGEHLAQALALPFYDADDFHFPENIEKMANGVALTDEDRQPWLLQLSDNALLWERAGGAVLACSALKKQYRDVLSSTIIDAVKFVYLMGDKILLKQRLNARENHFMSDKLLDSQLATLEVPEQAITVSIAHPVDEIVSQVLKEIH